MYVASIPGLNKKAIVTLNLLTWLLKLEKDMNTRIYNFKDFTVVDDKDRYGTSTLFIFSTASFFSELCHYIPSYYDNSFSAFLSFSTIPSQHKKLSYKFISRYLKERVRNQSLVILSFRSWLDKFEKDFKMELINTLKEAVKI